MQRAMNIENLLNEQSIIKLCLLIEHYGFEFICLTFEECHIKFNWCAGTLSFEHFGLVIHLNNWIVSGLKSCHVTKFN